MYALLFAGGVGQRLWPISRKNTPKQFSPLVESKSSLQLAVERLGQIVPKENIYVSANKRYSDLLAHQVGGVPETNLILEPVRRDLAAAVAFAFFKIQKKGIRGPIIFQWADNYIRHNEQLFRAINVGKELINDNPNRVVFLGEVPRFASENLGYIEHGDEIGCIEGVPYYSFRSWAYRPNLETCREMLKAGNYLWNAGYFVTTVEFIVSQYRRLAPEITQIVEEILSYEDTPDADHKLDELYPKLPAMHFDESFLMKLRPEQAVLLKVNLGWSDPGNLYSLKEALQTSQDSNVTRGEVVTLNTIDSLVINEEDGKTVSAMGLQGVMIVNTPDVLLVIAKDSVRHVRLLLDELEKSGKDDIL